MELYCFSNIMTKTSLDVLGITVLRPHSLLRGDASNALTLGVWPAEDSQLSPSLAFALWLQGTAETWASPLSWVDSHPVVN